MKKKEKNRKILKNIKILKNHKKRGFSNPILKLDSFTVEVIIWYMTFNNHIVFQNLQIFNLS